MVYTYLYINICCDAILKEICNVLLIPVQKYLHLDNIAPDNVSGCLYIYSVVHV